MGKWGPLAKRLEALRTEAGLSQQAAADLIGTSRVQWSRWESGLSRPGWENLRLISEQFGCPFGELANLAGYQAEDVGVSGYALSLARRIERRTREMTPEKRRAVERAVDSLLAAAV